MSNGRELQAEGQQIVSGTAKGQYINNIKQTEVV